MKQGDKLKVPQTITIADWLAKSLECHEMKVSSIVILLVWFQHEFLLLPPFPWAPISLYDFLIMLIKQLLAFHWKFKFQTNISKSLHDTFFDPLPSVDIHMTSSRQPEMMVLHLINQSKQKAFSDEKDENFHNLWYSKLNLWAFGRLLKNSELRQQEFPSPANVGI